MTRFIDIYNKADAILNIDKENVEKLKYFDTTEYWEFTLTQLDEQNFPNDLDSASVDNLKHNIKSLIASSKANVKYVRAYAKGLDNIKSTDFTIAKETLFNFHKIYESFIEKTKSSFSHVNYLLNKQ